MRLWAHALVLLIAVGLVAPARPAVAAQTADVFWDQGQQLMKRGDYAAAEQLYADMADRFGTQVAVAARARLLQARAALADGDPDTAEAVLQRLFTDYPSSDEAAGAYFTLEQVRRAANDCSGALRALDAFEATAGQRAIGPYGALQRAQCTSQLGDWAGELTASQTALSIDDGGPRLTRIEALERAAEAELKLGRKQAALDFYNRCLDLAATRSYRAEMLFTTAALARSLGQDDLAADRFRAVVVDYGDQARAPGALDALLDMERGASVSPLQAGMVRLGARDYQTAVSLLAQVDPASPDWGRAQLQEALALGKLNRESAQREVLQNLAANGSAQTAEALLQLGQLQERSGEVASALTTYSQMVDKAPDRAPEALFHVGFARLLGGDSTGAADAWRAGLASGPPTPAMQAQLLYWIAKVSGSDASLLSRAADAAPESYYGLRAQELLGTSLTIASSMPSTSTAWLVVSSNELQERDAWYASLGLSAQTVADDLAHSPGLQRADALRELGLVTESGWEVDAVLQQYVASRDLAHLNGLADWSSGRDLPQWTLRAGRQMRDIAGATFDQLPRAVQKQAYPAAWGDVVAEQAAHFGVDPLLMLALMRQESSFDPRAQSGAQAMGLTQVIPSTGRSIAARLNRTDFELRDLLKPAVSIQFGTSFLAQLLGDFQGRIFPALAAYDAGGGTVGRWLQRYGDDPDMLVEQVPFAETQNYMRIVYDNFWHYQALYGGPG